MIEEIECINCTSVNCFVKKYCTGDALAKVSNTKEQNFHKKGEFIFRKGNPMFGIHFIQKGGAKVVTPNLKQKEQVVRLLSDGNILGHKAVGNDKYYFNAIALMDTSICFVETSVFQETCYNSPNFAYHLILFYALELRRTELRVKYQSQMNIREKVAEAFIYLHEVFGINPVTKTLNIELSRQEIADTAGTTPEQVSRQLNDFEDEKLIARKKREIRLRDLDGLRKIVHGFKKE